MSVQAIQAIECKFQDHVFHFAETSQAREIMNEIFSDNYHVIQSGLVLPVGSVILDIGANEGMFSILMSHLYPESRIIALEPVPRTFFVMVGNVGRNGCGNIEYYNVGIGKPGQHILKFNVNKDGKSGGSSAWDTVNEGHTMISTACISLDEAFHSYHIDKVGLLKCDIEGGEYDAFYPCTVMDRIENLAIEIHANMRIECESWRPEALMSWLKNRTNLIYVGYCRMAE